jgi:hypothetical protein
LRWSGAADWAASRSRRGERKRLRFKTARADFNEWVTPVTDVGRIIDDRQYVRVRSLTGPVDVAMNTGGHVVETPEERYAVLVDVVFEYATPGDDVESLADDAGAAKPADRAKN